MDFGECLRRQIEEIESLQAILEENFKFISPFCLEELVEAAEAGIPSPRVEFEIQALIENTPIEISFYLPRSYPTAALVATFSCPALDKDGERRLTAECARQASTWVGEACVYTCVEWVREHAARYFASRAEAAAPSHEATSVVLVRQYIYFHHVYSREKMRSILGWASDFNITGFLLPGKPGAICAEGLEENVRDFVEHIRRLPWQKMQSRHHEREEHPSLPALRAARIFNRFEEHHDLAETRATLRTRGLTEADAMLFG
eukprot:m.17276 g.17276  ORF g.17276 m.17276 type:complete len:261 (-) comp7086_c0_seq2:22-804(-)